MSSSATAATAHGHRVGEAATGAGGGAEVQADVEALALEGALQTHDRLTDEEGAPHITRGVGGV
ncbi:MAG TPA: hypothetical protein PLI79_06040, partial [Mycobacterium sp.]|nr:hypothetical protein [Mycobacterium sp.]